MNEPQPRRLAPLASRALPASTVFAALLFLSACVLFGCPAEKRPACDPSTASIGTSPQRLCNPHSVILVRHAEKAAGETPDPELSPKGRARALRLATLLGQTAVTRLVATEFKRTQQTLEPLAERVHQPVEVRPSAQTRDLLRELRDAPPGSTTVVATHANVLPMIVRELGGGALRGVREGGALDDDEYARVLVLSVGCSTSASVVELSSD